MTNHKWDLLPQKPQKQMRLDGGCILGQSENQNQIYNSVTDGIQSTPEPLREIDKGLSYQELRTNDRK